MLSQEAIGLLTHEVQMMWMANTLNLILISEHLFNLELKETIFQIVKIDRISRLHLLLLFKSYWESRWQIWWGWIRCTNIIVIKEYVSSLHMQISQVILTSFNFVLATLSSLIKWLCNSSFLEIGKLRWLITVTQTYLF